MENREEETQGQAWAHARTVAGIMLGSAYSTYGERDPIPWWRPIPLSEEERAALAALSLLVRGGVVRRVVL